MGGAARWEDGDPRAQLAALREAARDRLRAYEASGLLRPYGPAGSRRYAEADVLLALVAAEAERLGASEADLADLRVGGPGSGAVAVAPDAGIAPAEVECLVATLTAQIDDLQAAIVEVRAVL